jgi:SPP1 gp7 family putative phage head morphogenesis protein
MFTFSPLPHEEAARRIAELPLVSREVMDEMLPELKAYAFTITGLDVGDQMAKVRDTLAAVPKGGKNWDKARAEIAAELVDDLGGKASERRAELLLRTHVFRGYAASRYRRLMQQVDVFPFWQYKTHGDGRVRPSHAALNGKIFPAGHQIWQRIFPPHDWGCRCIVVPLTRGAAERTMERAAKSEEQSAEGGNLLESQIVKPEMFTEREADLIAKNRRLPGGISLEPSPTWAQSPWTVPGNIQHDWKLIKERYSDQPEVLAAFEKWAAKTAIKPGVTVSAWIGEGPAILRQAMRKKSRFGFDVEFDEGEEQSLIQTMTGAGIQRHGAEIQPPPAPVVEKAQAFEAEVAASPVEHAAAWDAEGELRERRTARRRSRVSLLTESIRGGYTSHNHPAGGPPSLGDVNALLIARPLEMRIVTRQWLYRLTPGPRPVLDYERLPGFDRAWQAADIVAQQIESSQGWTPEQRDQAVQHALLSWLAKTGVIHYERLPR